VIDKTVEGVTFKFFVSGPTAAVWYGDARSDSSIEMRFVRDRILRPGCRVLECGSHHGYMTMMLSRWVGDQGKVYACEPVPDNVRVLTRNLDLNEVENVRVVPVAMGPKAGKVSLLDDTNGSVMRRHHLKHAIEVDMVTIDDFCAAEGFVPHLIKIDVEGFELDILEGAAAVLQRRPALHVEVHPHQISNYGKTVDQLWGFIDTDAHELWYQPNDMSEVRRIDGPIKIVDRSHIYCIPHGGSGHERVLTLA
jgi:FkbM family methyltransferase